MTPQLLERYYNAIWAIHPASFPFLLRAVEQAEAGNSPEPSPEKPQAYILGRNGQPITAGLGVTGVAIYQFEGMISSWWNDVGYFLEAILDKDADPSVVGHYVEMDCTGGDATKLLEATNTLQKMVKKPIVGRVTGYACSGGYWLAAAFNELYAASETNMIGSIGIVKTWRDWRNSYQKDGIKVHEVYATQSTEKNQPMIQANAGDYELLRASELDPFCQLFIDNIKTLRTATNDKEDVFTGKIFLAQEATDKGLIDGIKTRQEAIERVFALATAQSSTPSVSAQNLNSITQKVNPKMFAFLEKLGIKAGETLTDEWATKIEAALKNSETAQAENAEFKSMMAEMKTALSENKAALSKVEARLTEVEGQPAAAPATPAVPAAATTPTEKPWDNFNKNFAQAYINPQGR